LLVNVDLNCCHLVATVDITFVFTFAASGISNFACIHTLVTLHSVNVKMDFQNIT